MKPRRNISAASCAQQRVNARNRCSFTKPFPKSPERAFVLRNTNDAFGKRGLVPEDCMVVNVFSRYAFRLYTSTQQMNWTAMLICNTAGSFAKECFSIFLEVNESFILALDLKMSRLYIRILLQKRSDCTKFIWNVCMRLSFGSML